MSNLKPTDYHIGDRVNFYDAIAKHRIDGAIVEIDRNPEWEGSSGDWSGVQFWILVDIEHGEDIATPYRQRFRTGLFATTDLYWFAGDPEAEATPEDCGCYTIGKE